MPNRKALTHVEMSRMEDHRANLRYATESWGESKSNVFISLVLAPTRDVKKVLIVNLKREFEREPNSKILRWMKVHHSEVHGTEIKRIKARRIKLIKKVLFVNLKRLNWIKLKQVKWQWDESHSKKKRGIKASQNEAFWFSPHQPVKSLRCWRKF